MSSGQYNTLQYFNTAIQPYNLLQYFRSTVQYLAILYKCRGWYATRLLPKSSTSATVNTVSDGTKQGSEKLYYRLWYTGFLGF
jgi:hypothetical protein